MTTQTMLKMRGFAVVAAAGCFLTFNTPAQACNGGMQPNLNTGIAANMARLLKPEVRPPASGTTPAIQTGEAQQKNTPSIVGLWDTKVMQNAVLIDEGYEAFHSDSSEILVDIAPPATDNVCIGVWVQTGTLTFSVTHPSWTFDMEGNLTGTAVIQSSITLSHDGNSFTGTFVVDSYNTEGQHDGHLEGQLTSKRITAQ